MADVDGAGPLWLEAPERGSRSTAAPRSPCATLPSPFFVTHCGMPFAEAGHIYRAVLAACSTCLPEPAAAKGGDPASEAAEGEAPAKRPSSDDSDDSEYDYDFDIKLPPLGHNGYHSMSSMIPRLLGITTEGDACACGG